MLVSEIFDLNIADRTVCPSDDVLFCLASDNLEVVDAYELPHNGQYQLLVTLLNILGADAHQLELESLWTASIKSDLAVDSFLEIVVWVLFNSVPLDNSWVDFVDYFKKYLTIPALFVKIVDVNIF